MHQDLSKICAACAAELPLAMFYASKLGVLGRMHICKECHKTSVRKYRSERIDEVRAYDRARAGTAERKANDLRQRERRKKDPAEKIAARQRTRSWRANHPERAAAHKAVSRAVEAGTIKRPALCERCRTAPPVEAHHEDYSRPLDVVWMCRQCHKTRHKELRWGMAA